MINTDSKGMAPENLTDFLREHSPNIPIDFPKDRLPKELCQAAFIDQLSCLMKAPANQCGVYNKAFYVCRKERDALLFQSIKDWEAEKYLKIEKEGEKKGYLQELGEKKKDLEQMLQRTP